MRQMMGRDGFGGAPIMPATAPLLEELATTAVMVTRNGYVRSRRMETGNNRIRERLFSDTLILGKKARYRVRGKIAGGGMADVYSATMVGMKTMVAVKIAPNGPAHRHAIAHLQKEKEALERIRDPNVVEILDSGESHGMPFIVLPYLGRRTLKDFMHHGCVESDLALVKMLCNVCDGLAAAHAAGVVHGDINPRNVMMVGPGKKAVVVDFGSAAFLDRPEEQLRRRIIIGTSGFMAPEQGTSGAVLHPLTDVYGLGALMYYAVCGVPPFTGRTYYEILAKQAYKEVEAPSERGVITALQWIIMRALEPKPLDRFVSVLEVKQEILRAVYLSDES